MTSFPIQVISRMNVQYFLALFDYWYLHKMTFGILWSLPQPWMLKFKISRFEVKFECFWHIWYKGQMSTKKLHSRLNKKVQAFLTNQKSSSIWKQLLNEHRKRLRITYIIGMSQHAKWYLNKIEKAFNVTFAGWRSVHQRLRIYFVSNHSLNFEGHRNGQLGSLAHSAKLPRWPFLWPLI